MLSGGQARFPKNLRYVFEGFAVPPLLGVPNLNAFEIHLPVQQVLNLLNKVVDPQELENLLERFLRAS
jgi:hypothetical protein